MKEKSPEMLIHFGLRAQKTTTDNLGQMSLIVELGKLCKEMDAFMAT